MAENNDIPNKIPTGKFALLRIEVILGLILLVAVNAMLFVVNPLSKVDPESLPSAHSWVWWATQEFVKQPKAPDVVWLGSSLVMHPVSRLDADYLGKNLDYVKHHRSLYMENALEQRGAAGTVCYNFALPGGMVSDDYMVSRALFGKRKPAVVVLGLSIRDFMDNQVHCAGATPAFKYLQRYTSIDDLVDVSLPQIWQRADYLYGKMSYLWGKKLDIQVLLAEKVKKFVGPHFASAFPPSRIAEADPTRNQPSNLRSEVEEGMFIVQSKQPYSFEDNSKEYVKRYRSANDQMFKTQEFFFDKLVSELKQNGIEVVVVAMPVTELNHKLMPAGTYDRFIATLKNTSAKYSCSFLDLDSAGKFQLTDYYDTSHMNGAGGKKLVDSVAEAIYTQPSMVAALEKSARSSVAAQGQSF